MSSWPSLLLAGFLLASGAGTAHAQFNPARPATASSAPREARASDPLERDTPRKAILAFSRAVDREDYAVASRYAQLTRQQQQDAGILLRDLNELMARSLRLPLAAVSDAPEGTLDDGLPPDRERIGPLRIGEQLYAIDLVRVEGAGIPVWLISADTVRGIARFHALLPPTWAERLLPPAVTASSVFGISVVRLLVWAASIVVPLILLHFLSPLLRAGARRLAAPDGRRAALARELSQELDRLHWPLVLAVTLCVHLAALPSFRSSLPFRLAYSRVVLALLAASLAWAAERISTLAFHQAPASAREAGHAGTRSLLMLGERLMKVLIVLVAILVILSLFGVDTRTALAGVGIVGFGVALGAKKTIENILGGVMLLADQALAVGDECRISGRHGWVEDITLRSVRIRTREQTLISIPSGVLADASIENFSSRGKFLADNTLHPSLQATSEQLRQVRGGIEGLLRKHPEIEQESARIRLVGFGIHGAELELYAYFVKPTRPAFLAAREDLLLRIATVVESVGCTFAAPFESSRSVPASG